MTTDKKTLEIGKGKPGPGRPKGLSNKTTREIRAAWIEAFDNMGGTAALVRWGKMRPDLFYPALLRLLPREIAVSGELTVPHVLVIHDNVQNGGK